MAKSLVFGDRLPTPEPESHKLVTSVTVGNLVSTLCLSGLIYEMGVIRVPL